MTTFATYNEKPLQQSNPNASFGSYIDNGGVCKAGYAVTRTGQTFASRDIIRVQATTDKVLGVPTKIIHYDRTDWDYDEAAADNDFVEVAERGSGHIVGLFIQSAQGDLTAGTHIYSDGTGYGITMPDAAAGDSIQAVRDDLKNRLIGTLWEDSAQSTADPKVAVFGKVLLNL